MKLAGGYLIREVANQYVLFPVGQNVADFKNIVYVNDTGRYIVEKLQEDITYEDLLDGMAKEYEASEEEVGILEADLKLFLENLRGQGMLIE